MAEIAALIRRHYDDIARTAIDTTTELGQVAATSAARSLSVGLGEGVAPALPAFDAMRTLAGDAIVMGATQKAWWARQAADVAFRFSTAVRQGLVAAETNQQIIRRVRAELDVTRRNAAALVQTSVQTVANDARLATFRANSDVITALRWMATLDAHTCARCGARDGMKWRVDGTPIAGAEAFLNPPLHFNDRCVLVPETALSDLAPGTRASSEGQVSSKTTFSDFLDRQGKAFQDEVLGPGRAQMWRDGKITLTDLTSGAGRPLTLDQLRARHK
jgi:SPP1 gp7 family putative phage head morphogenesis protein